MTFGPRTISGLFAAGLVLRLLLIAAATPHTHTLWFTPFLLQAPHHLLDPWTAFLAAGGDHESFPYGPPYLVAFGPAVWIGGLVAGEVGAHVGLGLAVLFWELVLLKTIAALAGPANARGAMLAYWLSPIPLYVGYWHGQLDIFPVALLIAGLWAIRRNRFLVSGALLGAAVAAKLSMALPAPFIGLYFLGRRRLRKAWPAALGAAALVGAALLLPFCLSPGFRQMVLLTPETGKAFTLAVPIGPQLSFYLLPLAYLALLYGAWRVRRLDFDLLWAFTGVAFMALLLLTPASPGWVMWAMPFLALHAARSGPLGHVLYWPFALAFVLLHLTISSGAVLATGEDLTGPLARYLSGDAARASSILMTLTLAFGAALTLQMVRRGILASPFYLASRKPFVLAVAGDSGTGKDTLVDAIVGVFGSEAVTRVSGDDYHIWDRQKPMWRALTHLNPKANDLDTFARHVTELTDGKMVRARHYDHSSGRAGEAVWIKPQEAIAVSGLHALWSPALARLYDVRVFMDMDEDLRRFLKVKRDVGVRGQSLEKVIESIDRRAADGQRFIQPQARNADVVFRLEPRHPSAIADLSRDLDTTLLRLIVVISPGRTFDVLARLLTSLCGMQVIEAPQADGWTEVLIEGEPTAADIAAAARRLAPDMLDFLAIRPAWRPGLTGVMQLVVLNELDRSRRRRGIAA